MKSYNPACVSNKFGNVKHYFWIDYFRFIAALIVCLVHVRAYLFVNFSQIRLEDQTLINKIWFFVTRLGVESVVVFFVLSGFFVGGKALERFSNNNFNAKEYFIDRLSRIFVPLIPAIFITIIVNYIVSGWIDFPAVLANLASLQGVISPPLKGNGPLWSLSYEVWFYIFIGAIGLACQRKVLTLVNSL